MRGKIRYAIPVPLLFVARCTHQDVRQGHQQPIGGARSGWRRNARALRDDRKTKQNELAVRTLARRLVLLGPETNDLFMLLQMLDDCRHVRSLDCLPYWRPLSLFFLRTWHYELCIKASIPLPINSSLCLTIPGPAECAKRLNIIIIIIAIIIIIVIIIVVRIIVIIVIIVIVVIVVIVIIVIIIIVIIIIIYLLPRCRRPIVGWSAWCAGE